MIKTAHKLKISLFAIFLTIGLVSNAQKLSALQESFCQYLLNNEQYDLLDLKYFAQDSLNYNCTINIEDTLIPNIKNLFLANYPITEKLKEHINKLRQHDVMLLAQKIETYQEFELCRELGFELFDDLRFALCHDGDA